MLSYRQFEGIFKWSSGNVTDSNLCVYQQVIDGLINIS